MQKFLTSPTCKNECDAINVALEIYKNDLSSNENYLMDPMNSTCHESKINFLFISKNKILDQTTEVKDETISSLFKTFYIPQTKTSIINSFIDNRILSEQGDVFKPNSIVKTNTESENEPSLDFFKICPKKNNDVSKEEKVCDLFYSHDPFMQRPYDPVCHKSSNTESSGSLKEPCHESNAFFNNRFQTKSSSFSSFSRNSKDRFTIQSYEENDLQHEKKYHLDSYQETNSFSMDGSNINTEVSMQPALEDVLHSKHLNASNRHSSFISRLKKPSNQRLPKSSHSSLFEDHNKPHCFHGNEETFCDVKDRMKSHNCTEDWLSPSISKTQGFFFDTIPSDMLILYSPSRAEEEDTQISNDSQTNFIKQAKATNLSYDFNVLSILLKKTTERMNKILENSALDENLSRDLFLLMNTFKKVYYILFTICSKGHQWNEIGTTQHPSILGHPEEFKNPSSFLKIYGDPVFRFNRKKCFNSLPQKSVNGNWECHICKNINYPRRFRCNNRRCNAIRDQQGDKVVMAYAKEVFNLYASKCKHKCLQVN